MATTPPARPQPAQPEDELSPETEAKIRAGVESASRGETVVLTRAELDRWADTGELPEAWAPEQPARSRRHGMAHRGTR
jgi:hypothetical protein